MREVGRALAEDRHPGKIIASDNCLDAQPGFRFARAKRRITFAAPQNIIKKLHILGSPSDIGAKLSTNSTTP